MKAALSGLVVAIAPTMGVACVPEGEAFALVSEDGDSTEAFAVMGAQRLSQPFEFELQFCGGDAIERLDVAAIMPAHQHGMNYEPVVKPLSEGRFLVSGMVFHMPGHWEVQISAYGADQTRFYTLDQHIK